ncbi:hypothetical protein PAL_GLEAN10008851 [Pteropus alecto]|uniref:Uncharacterized protein n=1 Tax=Pteropus alecto TaxID=9402 RepID=L5KSA5_PTEAL|nr:hypothetical protein PAL_GLEAN10008851 [Pteropus alecto]
MALGWPLPCGFLASVPSSPRRQFGHHFPQPRRLGVGRTLCCLKQVPLSALLQASPLKNMSASVPPQRWFRCGRIPGLRPPSCRESQLPSPTPARHLQEGTVGLFCHHQQLDGAVPSSAPA